jgi:biopolymer transport protein ExbD
MPKIKSVARTPRVDMTPMVDLFSLLLTFFILTATFRPTDPAQITIPNSISEKVNPDKNILTIFISPDKGNKAKVFLNFDNGEDTSRHYRAKLLEQMGTQYRMKFTPAELDIFSKRTNFGMPMNQFRAWLHITDTKKADAMLIGIPTDSLDNQLSWWIRNVRLVNQYAEVAIKADGDVPFPLVKKVMDIVQDNKVNKFNLITTFEKQDVGVRDIPK